MSWKSIVITGLFCVVASPALAVPTVSANLLGLDTAGNWVWEISVDPDQTLFTNPVDTPDRGTGGSVAIEVGIQATTRGVVSAAPNLTNFPNPSAAGPPFGNGPANFAQMAGGGTDIDGNAVRDEGVVFNTTTDRVVAYLGSEFFGSINFGATNGDPKAAFRIHTEKPTSAALVTALQFSGAYNADGTLGGALGMVAQDSAQTGFNLGTVSKGVVVGNTNLDGVVNIVDGGKLASNFGQPGTWKWQDGDFNGDGLVNIVDGGGLASNFGAPDPNWVVAGAVNLPLAPGAGSGGISGQGVPEPGSVLLLVLGSGLLALAGRKRQ